LKKPLTPELTIRNVVANPDDEEGAIFIEMQTGDFFGKDDIESNNHDFGRTA
jgi:hypothetical protein